MVGCPVCLREDAEAHHGIAIEAMVMRGDWQLREASICVRHCHPLVFLWKEMALEKRYDIGSQLRQVAPQILSGALDQQRVIPTSYDLWLEGRLGDGQDQTWLGGCSLYAATTFCRLLGVELLRMTNCADHDDFRKLHAARAAGFDVARQGEAAIRSAFNDLAQHADGMLDEPKKAFGQIFSKLRNDYALEAAFDPFRKILRECILDVWPLAAGEDVLGEVVPERRLHSVLKASREAGVGAKVLSLFLTEAGAIAPDDLRPHSRMTFDAREHAALLAEVPTLVGSTEMRTAMGATQAELAALATDGILVPRTRNPRIRSPWRIADGLALVDELSRIALAVDPTDQSWERIQSAHSRKGVRVGEVISAIRSGRLAIGQCAGCVGYRHFLVRRAEIDRIAPPIRRPETGEIIGVMSAAEFGRMVGLRNNGYFLALAEAGHTPSTPATNSNTGQSQVRMTESDIAAFHGRFVTVATLGAESGLHRNTLRRRLPAHGVQPFSPRGCDFGPVYLREDVERFVPELRKTWPA